MLGGIAPSHLQATVGSSADYRAASAPGRPAMSTDDDQRRAVAAAQLRLVTLTSLVERSVGAPSVRIGLVDGPVALHHPDLAEVRVYEPRPTASAASGSRMTSAACSHGTFVAGILFAKRGSSAPGLCPGSTLVLRPIFSETGAPGAPPSATPDELSAAIIECIEAGARVINLSLALVRAFARRERLIREALDYAAAQGVLVVAAAGNLSTVASSTITNHPWVVPVVACDSAGRPANDSTLAGSIGRRGLRAPGIEVTSLGADGDTVTRSGTSAAAAFVTGAIALLWAEFPRASAAQILFALMQPTRARRASVVPPLLDAAKGREVLARAMARERLRG
jgi:subtilisin family serine protease